MDLKTKNSAKNENVYDDGDDHHEHKNEYITIKPSKSSNELKPIIKRKSSNALYKNMNFIINNSIDSHMLINSFDLKAKQEANPSKKLQKLKNKDIEAKKPQYTNIYLPHDTNTNNFYVNDEDMSLFQNSKNKPQPISTKTNDYKSSLRLPLIQLNGQDTNNCENYYYSSISSNPVPLSIQPIVTSQTNDSPASSSTSSSSSIYATVNLNKKNSKFNELKVFSTEVAESPAQFAKPADVPALVNKNLLPKSEFQLPKNSTPLFNDSNNAAELVNRRKQFLNAELNLTIAPLPASEIKSVFLVPRVPPPMMASNPSSHEKTVIGEQRQNQQTPPFASTPMTNYQQQQTQLSDAANNKYFRVRICVACK